MTTFIFLLSLYVLAGIGDCFNSSAFIVGNQELKLYHTRQSRSVSGDSELNNGIPAWAASVTDSFSHLSKVMTWKIFLNSFYRTFSGYEIQVAKNIYNVPDINDWGKLNDAIEDVYAAKESLHSNQGIIIDRNNFEIFLDKIEDHNIEQHHSVKNMVITDLQLEELNHVLNLTIKQGIRISCQNNHMFIKGNYIIVSHISRYIWTGKVDDSCRGLLFTNRLKFLNIFALNTLFIDADMPSLGMLEPMTVIAPKWEIIGTRKIDFSGKDGDFQTRQSSTSLYYMHGTDGKPGKPGEPGGNFFGIGDEFVNGADLTIYVNGGNGSPGQEGENGRDGNDGITPTVPSGLSCRRDLCDNNQKINFFKCELFNCYYRTAPALTAAVSTYREGCRYKIFGESGKEGGNGGNGGKGGIGGKHGNVEIYELNRYSGISKISNSGQDGIDGRGGTGGLGGKRGNDIIADCKTYNNHWSLENTMHSYERAASGQNGFEGANSKDLESPKAATGMLNLDKAKIINQYKSYLRENLNDRFTHDFLINFLKQLENNYKVKSVYNTLGLIDELQSLEEHFYRLNEAVDMLPFYQSLLHRISEYAKNPAEDVNPDLYRKVLGYLYTVTLGRIYNLEEELESNLIIDITTYLDSVKNDIQNLQDLQNSKNKEEVINKYKQEYKNEIDAKIKEAIDIISKDIIPEIQNIGTDIETQMEALINEVTHLRQQTRIEHEKLTVKQQELENVLVFQNVISSLKIFGQVITFLGPVGAAVGSVIGVGGTVAETFIFNTPGNLNSTPPLTQSVADLESVKGQIKRIRDQKVASLKTSLEAISQEADKHPHASADISVKMSDFRSRLDRMSGNRINFQEIQDLEIEIKATLQTQDRQQINSQGHTTEQKTNSDFIIQKAQKTIQMSSVILDSYNKHKYNQANLDTINEAVRKNENKFYKLKQYEDKFYSTIVPMVQKIQDDIDSLVNKLDTKSKVALDVAKWKIKSTLGVMIVQMKELTSEFKVQGDLENCIENMKEAMVMLINVHDHIQDFQKEETFANLIADINSITVSNTHLVYNPKLEDDFRFTLRDLEIAVRSTIVVQRHKVAVDAFKQFVFPFADYYFKGLILPTHLKLNGDRGDITLENLVFKAVIEIDHLKSKLQEYDYTVRNQDGCIYTEAFKSNYVSTNPFYVWNNEEHGSMISKLLSGETVVVKADVKESAPNKDAIKFNVIDFNFKSKDEAKQSEISDILRGFRISATHLGDSYYRYGNKIYLMMTPSREISYNLDKMNNDEPTSTSVSYKKLKRGDFRLSPYANWKLQLHKITHYISFRNLERYSDEIDLELGGSGYYVDKRNVHCSNLNLETYYKEIDTYGQEDSKFQSFSPLSQSEGVANSLQNQEEGIIFREEPQFYPTFDQDYYESQDNPTNYDYYG